MKITWLGQSTFEIKSKSTLVIDPHNPLLGRLPKDLKAEVVAVSHGHGDHSYTKGVGGDPKIINLVGNFVAAGFKLKGIATFHDNENGKKRGDNIVYVISADGLKVCHLGDLGHVLSEAQIKAIGAVDILMIPVGGRVTLGAAEAVQVVGQLKPKVVLPMHYKPANIIIPLPIAGVEDFTKLIDWKTQELKELDVDSTTVTRFNHQVIVLANNS